MKTQTAATITKNQQKQQTINNKKIRKDKQNRQYLTYTLVKDN